MASHRVVQTASGSLAPLRHGQHSIAQCSQPRAWTNLCWPTFTRDSKERKTQIRNLSKGLHLFITLILIVGLRITLSCGLSDSGAVGRIS